MANVIVFMITCICNRTQLWLQNLRKLWLQIWLYYLKKCNRLQSKTIVSPANNGWRVSHVAFDICIIFQVLNSLLKYSCFPHEETLNHFHGDPLTRRRLHDHPMIAISVSLAQETTRNWLLYIQHVSCLIASHAIRTKPSSQTVSWQTSLIIRCFPS